jgi:phospholipase/carboxylesterase
MSGVDLRPRVPGADPHAATTPLRRGPAGADARVGLVLIHGRGDSAAGIAGLVDALVERGAPEPALVAPEAYGGQWYPLRFLEPVERNEPWLSSALASVGRSVALLEAEGLSRSRIVVAGFSQGACLAAEYVAREGGSWGGVVALSGGLIGADVDPARYPKRLDGTPAFFGCSDVDAHIPEARVHASAAQYGALGAEVVTRIYPGMAHTVNEDEATWFAAHLARVARSADGGGLGA